MKNNRMYMAQSIKEVMTEGTLKKRSTNRLKNVVSEINESLLIDVLLTTVSSISYRKSNPYSMLITKLINSIASEVLYKRIENQISKYDMKNFHEVISKENVFINQRINAINSNYNIKTRNNLVRLIMCVDPYKFSSTSKMRVMFAKKSKKQILKNITDLVKGCRIVLDAVLVRYNEYVPTFEFIDSYVQDKKASYHIKGILPVLACTNYMKTSPSTIIDMPTAISIKETSLTTVAVSEIATWEFTFDKEFNNAISAIIDDKLFDELLIGSSTKTQGLEEKVKQARDTIKEGLIFWEEREYGNVYFDFITDFRGRISQCGGISAVGHKPGKSMLRSGRRDVLGVNGYDNMLIALAGSMGYDKDTFNTRLKWGKANIQTFIGLGNMILTDPKSAFTHLKKIGAENAFDCAAISLELARVDKFRGRKEDFKSNLFIGYDATSSAVQIVGLMMGSETLTEASNVRVGPDTENKIYDAYMLICDSMSESIAAMLTDDNKIFLDMWTSFDKKTQRAFGKVLMMPRLYGSKILTHIDSCRNMAVEKGILSENDINLTPFSIAIAKLFNNAFNNGKGYSVLRAYEMYTKEIARAYSSTNQDVQWTVYNRTNLGNQHIRAKYRKYSGDQYTFYREGKKRKSRTYGLDILDDCKDELNYKEDRILNAVKAYSAMPPNYIHSHDAMFLHMVAVKMQCSIRLTHDCVAVTPGRVDDIQKVINETFVELFGDNNLRQLERLQEDCKRDTGILVELPSEYNPKGIKSNEIKKAIYAYS